MKKTAIFVALLALLFIFTGCSAGKVNKVCELTEADIKSKLKAPATSQFPDCADRGVEEVEPDIFMVDSYYDAQKRLWCDDQRRISLPGII
jgi:PBP1b-binding outer membrane lipoprotein LpoB